MKGKNEIRCFSCGKKLAEEISIQEGFVKIKCNCGVINNITAEPEKKEKPPVKEKAEYGRFPTDWNARVHKRHPNAEY